MSHDPLAPLDPVNTLPTSPEPPLAVLELALRTLPGLLNNTPDIRPDVPLGSDRRVLYAMLRDTLEDLGHTRDAAEWAVHRHVEAGRLIAEPMPPPTQLSRCGPAGEWQEIPANDREYCVIRAAPTLWVWSEETERAATGSPLAVLRGEQDVLHAFARRRAEEERKRREEEARREAFRLRWVDAVESAGRIDPDAESNGWGVEQKLAEYVARLLRLGAIIREWDEYTRRWVESRPDPEIYGFRSWRERLRGAASVGDAPLEFRFAAGLMMLAEQDNGAALAEEIRQLLVRRDLSAVGGWFPWLWDSILPTDPGYKHYSGVRSYVTPPLGPLQDENRARIALGMSPWIDRSAAFRRASDSTDIRTTETPPPATDTIEDDVLESDVAQGGTNAVPAEAAPFARLRALVGELRLKGVEAEAVIAICDGHGAARIADLAPRFEWANPADNWNSTRKRLNEKFKGRGWRFSTLDNTAVAEQVPPTG